MTKILIEQFIFSSGELTWGELYIISSILGLNNPSIMTDWMIHQGIPIKFRYLIQGELYINNGMAAFAFAKFKNYCITGVPF